MERKVQYLSKNFASNSPSKPDRSFAGIFSGCGKAQNFYAAHEMSPLQHPS